MKILVFNDGVLEFDGATYRCALGKAGISKNKCEGDGATPTGSFPLLRLFRRADKHPDIQTALPVQDIREDHGWCDDPKHAAYNQLVHLPFEARHEKMWREDALYDLVIEIGHNHQPVVPGAGSAVFIHVAKPDFAPTEGCVALAKQDLISLLPRWNTNTEIEIFDQESR